ncbi:hypothetical protein [Acidovorax sp. Root219]|uniref:hypothetical protein n=1 Tax=Acidovorax sp. Root219 TaxID=1736493 RepID=UPI000AFAB5DF|nr:hypothetical protein [Acidovorax sp. Root219]
MHILVHNRGDMGWVQGIPSILARAGDRVAITCSCSPGIVPMTEFRKSDYIIKINEQPNHKMTLQPKFATDALDRLAERVDYEEWFLEAIHSIAEQDLFPSWPDAVIYPINQPKPIYYTFGRGNVILGDWRPGFLAAGAPLIFICTFKILDMLIEWILNENGLPSSFRFQEKLKNLKNSPKFPPVIECRPWLQERLIGLYAELEPLRGTVIHDKHFTSTGGGIEVSSSKKGAVGPPLSVCADSLRKLGLTIVSILKYVKGTWLIDDFR